MTKEEYFLNPNKCNVCLSTIEYNSRARVRNRKYCNLQCFSKEKYFQEHISKKYLDIITNIVESKLLNAQLQM